MHDVLFKCSCGFQSSNEDVYILHVNNCEVAKEEAKNGK